MKHLEDRARRRRHHGALTGNNNGTFNSGVGALDIDGPDSYRRLQLLQPDAVDGLPDIPTTTRPASL